MRRVAGLSGSFAFTLRTQRGARAPRLPPAGSGHEGSAARRPSATAPAPEVGLGEFKLPKPEGRRLGRGAGRTRRSRAYGGLCVGQATPTSRATRSSRRALSRRLPPRIPAAGRHLGPCFPTHVTVPCAPPTPLVGAFGAACSLRKAGRAWDEVRLPGKGGSGERGGEAQGRRGKHREGGDRGASACSDSALFRSGKEALQARLGELKYAPSRVLQGTGVPPVNSAVQGAALPSLCTRLPRSVACATGSR